MSTPIRCVGHSPYSTLRAVHPPRTREIRQATRGSGIGFALLWCALCLGFIGGLTFTNYWRELLAVVGMFAFSGLCGIFIHAIDQGGQR